MGITIDKISVKDLGPIKNFTAGFGLFNLIYSKNERGKTFLTEFIIRSLFRNTGRWSYIRSGGKGKVAVKGLDDKKLINFTPSSLKKLEDYWEKSEKGLPLSISKLLVVKGGEAGIEDGEGISRFLVREVLSGINVLDKIDSDTNISKTVKDTEIKNSHIIISDRGEGKRYNNIKKELNDIEKLFEEIESGYTRGILRTYRLKEKKLKDRLEQLTRAKRHLAYLISEKIKKLKLKLLNSPDDELNKLENEISIYKSKQETCSRLRDDYKDTPGKSRDFKWLESALFQYRELLSKVTNKPGKLLPVLAGIFAAGALAASVLLFFSYTDHASLILLYPAIICFCIPGFLISIAVYIKKIINFSKQMMQNEELRKICEEFKKRTGRILTDISLLESTLNEYREYNSRLMVIENQINSLEKELQEKYFFINRKIKNLCRQEVSEEDWETATAGLKQNNINIKNRIDDEKEKLYKLAVPEEDYLSEEVEAEYSQKEYEKTQTELENLEIGIREQENRIQNLKQKICDKTEDELSISWEELIDNLQKKREQTLAELNEIAADIIAGSIVHRVISRLRREEDEKIKEGLQSETVTGPLKDITQRYDNLTLDNDNLIVSDSYDDFNIRDLSTGAKEQVMLALRIGFTSKLLKKESLFLILDDAFQHSDWEKREVLTDKLAEIARKGWQIIYLTMDNHIKELFEKTGKKFQNGKYKKFEL